MKILIFNTLYWPKQVGGAEVSVGYLAKGFKDEGHEVVVCCIGTDNKIYFDNNGIKVIQIKIKNIFFPFSKEKPNLIKRFLWHIIDNYNFIFKTAAEKIINDFKPDVIHTNNLCGMSVAVWDIAKKFNIKLVHTSRDYYLLHPSSKISKSSNFLTKISMILWSFVKRYKSKHVQNYIGISKFIMDEHVNNGFFKKSKRHVIYNSQPLIEVLRSKKTKYNNFGFIGRVSEEKGIEILLNAFIIANISDSKLFIAGDGDSEYLNNLKSKYEKNNIIFLGKVEPEKYYELININVVPSVWEEPLGRVVIEAYSYGVPSIVSCSGGLPEMIIESVTGFTYSKYSVDELVQILQKWRYEIDKNYVENCLEQMKKYTVLHISKEYLKVYES